MTGTGSPCGACKFLRRKCVRGCVFAPYFAHEQGATHFAAIHKVFGASNVSKLLAHLPVSDRCEAAVTISYEAQARLQDPIYGCVSHIFALQQQVVNLQAQLASLKEQAAQSILKCSVTTTNPNEKLYGPPQDGLCFFYQDNFSMPTQYVPSSSLSKHSSVSYSGKEFINHQNNIGNYENSVISGDQDVSFASFGEPSHCFEMQADYGRQWFQDADDLQSVAFGGYTQYSS